MTLSSEKTDKEVNKFMGIMLTAAREKSIFMGHTPYGMGVLMYQMEGNRLIASLNSYDAVLLANENGEMPGSGRVESGANIQTVLEDFSFSLCVVWWFSCCSLTSE